jgi:hypothetical protein
VEEPEARPTPVHEQVLNPWTGDPIADWSPVDRPRVGPPGTTFGERSQSEFFGGLREVRPDLFTEDWQEKVNTDGLNALFAGAENPGQEADRVMNAYGLSQITGRPLREVYDNYDVALEAYFGEYGLKNPGVAIRDELRRGILTNQLSEVTAGLLRNPNDETLLQQAAAISAAMPTEDVRRRGLKNLPVEMAKAIAQNGPLVLDTVMEGAIAGAAMVGATALAGVSPITGGLSLIPASAIAAWGLYTQVGSTARFMDKIGGLILYDSIQALKNHGVEEIPQWVVYPAQIGGWTSAMLEAVQVNQLFKGMGVTNLVADSIAKANIALLQKGILASSVVGFAARHGMNVVGNVAEELVQETQESYMTELTKYIYNQIEDEDIAYQTVEELRTLWSETARSTALFAGGIGLAGSINQTVQGVRSAEVIPGATDAIIENIRAGRLSDDEMDTVIKAMTGEDVVRPEGLEVTESTGGFSVTYGDRTMDIDVDMDADGGTATIRAINTDMSDTQSVDALRYALADIRAQNPDIEFDIDRDNPELMKIVRALEDQIPVVADLNAQIDAAQDEQDAIDVRRDELREARREEGADTDAIDKELDELETAAQNNADLIDQILQKKSALNPLDPRAASGKLARDYIREQAQVQPTEWSETPDSQWLRTRMQTLGVNPAQAEAVVMFVDMVARLRGTTVENLLRNSALAPDFLRGDPEGVLLKAGVKGATHWLNSGKAIIFATKASDLSTFIHELTHVFAETLSDADKKIIADWAGDKQFARTGTWTQETHEAFARASEQWIMDNAAEQAPEEVRGVFQKFKEFMLRIYRGLREFVNMTPEVEDVLRRLYMTEQPFTYPGRVSAAGDTQFQEEFRSGQDPDFYSHLYRVVDAAIPGKSIPVQDLKRIIGDSNRGIKAEEIKWSGILDAIDDLEEDGKVSREAIIEWMKNDGRVEMFTAPGIVKFGGMSSFEEYSLLGGKDYRETILVAPTLLDGGSSHFGNEGYIAHVRSKERTFPDGRGLFLEELQSDLHQKGRERGYMERGERPRYEVLEERRDELLKQMWKLRFERDVADLASTGIQHPGTFEEHWEETRSSAVQFDQVVDYVADNDPGLWAEYNRVNDEFMDYRYNADKRTIKVPDAPFRKDWPLQLFKRSLRDAVDRGMDWIGWTDGTTQKQRYQEQLQTVENISLRYLEGGKWYVRIDFEDSNEIERDGISKAEVTELLGAPVANELFARHDKILKYAEENAMSRKQIPDATIAGDEITDPSFLQNMGETGHNTFYDKIVPNAVRKYVKRLGGTVEHMTDFFGPYSAIPEMEVERAMRKAGFDTLALAAFHNDDLNAYLFETRQDFEAFNEDFEGVLNAWDGDIDPGITERASRRMGDKGYWRVEITPEMKKLVQDGQTLFQTSIWDVYAIRDNQSVTSEATSRGNANRAPATYKIVQSRDGWEPGTLNADIGSGPFPHMTEALRQSGVENVMWDPFGLDSETNNRAAERFRGGKADTVTVNNVLNIMKKRDREATIKRASDALKPDGTAYFYVYVPTGADGKWRQTGKNQGQTYMKAEAYIPEIEKYFAQVERKDKLITAKGPLFKEDENVLFQEAETVRGLSQAIERSGVGKTIGSTTYVHASALGKDLPYDANVVKYDSRTGDTSYLVYNDFDGDPHPALTRSYTVRGGRVIERNYDPAVAPILHRKELMVAADHPMRDEWVRRTNIEESFGLYRNPRSIGRRHQWQQAMEDAGVNEAEIQRMVDAGDGALPHTRNIDVTLFQVVGPKANLSPELRSQVTVAQEMEKAGKSPFAIWNATGWRRGVWDARWRTDIPSDSARLRDIGGWNEETGDLEMLIYYPELFRAYPEFKTYQYRFKDMGRGTLGSWDWDTNTINLNKKLLNWIKDDFGAGSDSRTTSVDRYAGVVDNSQTLVGSPMGVLQTIMHELTHAIQTTEGWNHGANYNAILDKHKRNYHDLIVAHNAMVDEYNILYDRKAPQGTLDKLYGEIRLLEDRIKMVEQEAKSDALLEYLLYAGELEAREEEARVATADEVNDYSLPQNTIASFLRNEGLEEEVTTVFQEAEPTAADWQERYGESLPGDQGWAISVLQAAKDEKAGVEGAAERLKALKEEKGLNPDKKNDVDVVGRTLAAMTEGSHKLQLRGRTEEDARELAKMISAEVAYQMTHSERSGVGWYSSNLRGAMRRFKKAFPELKKPENMLAFKLALAITSQEQNVFSNADNAVVAYLAWRHTGNFASYGSGGKSGAMVSNFEKLNALYENEEFGGDWKKIQKFLTDYHSVKKLRDDGWNITDELVDQELPGSIILGAKIGGGFFSNLQGNYKLLTMDLWFMRTAGRLIGDLAETKKPETIEKNRLLALDAVRNAEDWMLQEIRLLKADGTFGETIEKMRGTHDREAILNDPLALEKFMTDLNSTLSRAAKNLEKQGRKAEAVKRGFKNVWGLIKAPYVYDIIRHRNDKKALQSTPRNASDRLFWRNTINHVLEELRDFGYTELQVADIQAIMWFLEKDLYRALNAADKASESADYEDAARRTVLALLSEGTANDDAATKYERIFNDLTGLIGRDHAQEWLNSTRDHSYQPSRAGVAGTDVAGGVQGGTEQDGQTAFQRADSAHEGIVREAVASGEYVSEKILRRYAGMDWADAELRRRARLKLFRKSYPSFYEEARKAKTEAEFIAAIMDKYDDIMFPEDRDIKDVQDFLGEIYDDANAGNINQSNKQWLESITPQEITDIVRVAAQENWGIDPLIDALGRRVIEGRPLTDTQMSRVRDLFQKNATRIRRRYYETTENAEEAQRLEREVASSRRGGIVDLSRREPRPTTRLAAADLDALRSHPDWERIKEGSLTAMEIDNLIDQLEADRVRLTGENELLKSEELNANLDTLVDDETIRREMRSKDREIKRNQKLAKKYEEQLAAARKKQTEIREFYKDKLTKQREEIKAKQDQKRALQKLREEQKRLAKAITRPPGDSIAYAEQQQITAIQLWIDPNFRSSKTMEWRNKMRKWYDENPDYKAALPDHVFKEIFAKTLNELTLEELRTLYDHVELLRKNGREKESQRRALRAAKVKAQAATMARAVTMGKQYDGPKDIGSVEYKRQMKKGRWKRLIRTEVLRAPRWLLDLDNGVQGPVYDLFWTKVNDLVDEEIEATFKMENDLRSIMKELGIKPKELNEELTHPDGAQYTVQEVMSMYAALQNDLKKAAIAEGNKIGEDRMRQFVDLLDDKFKKFTDWMIDYYEFGVTGKDVELLDKAMIERYNRGGIFTEPRYTPIRRQNEDYTTLDQEVAGIWADRMNIRRAFVNKDFTKSRIRNIAPENQPPVRLGEFDLFLESKKKHLNLLIWGDAVITMQKVLSKKIGGQEFVEAVNLAKGREYLKALEQYVNDLADPYAMKAISNIEKASRFIRVNFGLSKLGLNLKTVMNQAPSLVMFNGYAGPMSMMAAAAEYAANPRAFQEKVWAMFPQVRDRAYNRLIDEVKQMGGSKWDRFSKANAKVTMWLTQQVDSTVVTMGTWAVYQTRLKQINPETGTNYTEQEAKEYARDAFLKTQPAGRPKDLPHMMRQGEVMRWFTMFGNQLNQYLNIMLGDLPVAWKNRQYGLVVSQVTSMMISGFIIGMIARGRPPEDPLEDPSELLYDAVFRTPLTSLPFIGREIEAAAAGSWYGGGGVNPMEFVRPAGTIIKLGVIDPISGEELDEDDLNKLMLDTFRSLSTLYGIPHVQLERMWKLYEDGYWGHIIGAKPD